MIVSICIIMILIASICIIMIVSICIMMILIVSICIIMILTASISTIMILTMSVCTIMILIASICTIMILIASICTLMILIVSVCIIMILTISICIIKILIISICIIMILIISICIIMIITALICIIMILPNHAHHLIVHSIFSTAGRNQSDKRNAWHRYGLSEVPVHQLTLTVVDCRVWKKKRGKLRLACTSALADPLRKSTSWNEKYANNISLLHNTARIPRDENRHKHFLRSIQHSIKCWLLIYYGYYRQDNTATHKTHP